MNSEKPNAATAIINNSGIMLEQNSTVRQIGLYLNGISRNGNTVTLSGVKTLSGAKEPITVTTSYRSVKYLNTKSAKVGNKSMRPFSVKNWLEFNEKPITGEPIKPAYIFFVNVLAETKTNIGYALTFKRLVPLTEKVFLAYLKGEQPKEPSEVPFNLGYSQIETKNGRLSVNFGLLNGNSGISITNANGVKLNLAAKHLPNSVYALCATLKKVISSEKIQTAPSAEKAAEAWQMLRGGISF